MQAIFKNYAKQHILMNNFTYNFAVKYDILLNLVKLKLRVKAFSMNGKEGKLC